MNTGPQLVTAVDSEAFNRYLYWWLLLAIVFEYARPGSFVPVINALKLNSLIPLSLVVLCVFARGLRPVGEIIRDPFTKWLLIYFGLITLSMVHAEVTLTAFDRCKQALGYMFLFFAIVRIVTSYKRLCGVFIALIAAHLFLLLMNPNVVLHPEQRNYIIGGTFLGDGNDFALSLCILLPMVIALALNVQSKWRRLMWWSTLSLLLFAVIATSSRGATLALIAVFGYLWLVSPRKGLTLLAVALGVVAILVYAPASYFERISTITTYEEDGSAMGRIEAWKGGLKMVRDHPLLGVGAGHFPMAFGWFYNTNSEKRSWVTAHSMYFLVLGELGLPGIVALLMLVFGSMRASTRVRRHLLARAMPEERRRMESARLLYLLNASMLGLAVAGAFLSVAYYPHLFVLTGLMVSCRCIAQGVFAADACIMPNPNKPALRSPVRSGFPESADIQPEKRPGYPRPFS